jgi:indole-3-glycerol phosphate synthase
LPETQGSGPRDDILRSIVESKRSEVAALSAARRGDLRARAADAPPPRDFRGALGAGARVSLIAEIKRRSPGAGEIRPGLDPAALAGVYAGAGAAAVSVLTDGPYFGGSLADLAAVRAAVTLPVLRKDFTLDSVQVDEARAAGADAVLLIARILPDARLVELRDQAEALGMAALVEVHDGAELDRAVAAGTTLLGINNRDLTTFRTDLAVTERLVDGLPAGVVVVSESGVRTGADVARLGEAGVDAVLVGEALLRAPDPGARVTELVGHCRSERVRG